MLWRCLREGTKYVHIKSTTVYAPRRNWDSPQPPNCRLVCPLPPCFWGEGNTRWRERGWESPNSDEGHTLWYSLYVRTLWFLLSQQYRGNCPHHWGRYGEGADPIYSIWSVVAVPQRPLFSVTCKTSEMVFVIDVFLSIFLHSAGANILPLLCLLSVFSTIIYCKQNRFISKKTRLFSQTSIVEGFSNSGKRPCDYRL